VTRLVVLIVLLVSGCGAYTSYKHTRLAPAGKTDWIFATQLSGAGTGTSDNAPLPELAAGARRRVHDRIDAGLTTTFLPLGPAFSTFSAEASGKAFLGRRGRWSAAVGAGAGYRITYSSGAILEGVHVAAPLILAADLGRHQLVYSPTAGYQRVWSTGARPVDVPFAGWSLGFRWQLNRRWALLPEGTVGYTPARNFMTDDSRLFHVGVALLLSSR
jgi:hypothetical protein